MPTVIVLTPTGWTGGTIVPYVNGVITDMTSTQAILNNTAPGCDQTVGNWFSFVLNRGADTASTLWYSKIIADSGSGAAYSEFLGGATSEISNFVSGWYYSVLNRAPDSSGLAYWIDQVKATGYSQAHSAFVAAAQAELHH
jgi:hypothetical protein